MSLAKLASFSPVRHGAHTLRVAHASRRVSARAMLRIEQTELGRPLLSRKNRRRRRGARLEVHARQDTPSRPKATIPVVTPEGRAGALTIVGEHQKLARVLTKHAVRCLPQSGHPSAAR